MIGVLAARNNLTVLKCQAASSKERCLNVEVGTQEQTGIDTHKDRDKQS